MTNESLATLRALLQAYSERLAAAERLGTIGVEALSPEWVETNTLNFIDAVLKAN